MRRDKCYGEKHSREGTQGIQGQGWGGRLPHCHGTLGGRVWGVCDNWGAGLPVVTDSKGDKRKRRR